MPSRQTDFKQSLKTRADVARRTYGLVGSLNNYFNKTLQAIDMKHSLLFEAVGLA